MYQNRNESNRENKNPALKTEDIKDSPQDEKRMQPEETSIDMPEVRDIPGQEHIHPAPLGELADTTISSDDEEADNLLSELNEEPKDLDE
ncbi:MAG: hypothetical protein JWN76_1331 [Chitinophagaceae bacterium]|nr:hypothetical protein [Chitinophagaceae bacterium]